MKTLIGFTIMLGSKPVRSSVAISSFDRYLEPSAIPPLGSADRLALTVRVLLSALLVTPGVAKIAAP